MNGGEKIRDGVKIAMIPDQHQSNIQQEGCMFVGFFQGS